MINFRYHITGAVNDNRILNPRIHTFYLVLIVQGGIGDHHTAHFYWLKASNRGQDTGSTDLDINGLDSGPCLFSGKFMGDRPTRCPSHSAQGVLNC